MASIKRGVEAVGNGMLKLADAQVASGLVAMSALLSSVQGIAAEYSTLAAIVLGALGSLVASVTVVCLVVASAARSYRTAAATRVDQGSDALVTKEEMGEWDGGGV